MAWSGQRSADGTIKYVRKGEDKRQNLNDGHKIAAMNFVSTSVLTSSNGIVAGTEVRNDDVEVTGEAAARGSNKTLYEQLEESRAATSDMKKGKIFTMYGDGTAKALDDEEVDFLDEQRRIKEDRRHAVAEKERDDMAEFKALRAERVRPAKELARGDRPGEAGAAVADGGAGRQAETAADSAAKRKRAALKTRINVRPRFAKRPRGSAGAAGVAASASASASSAAPPATVAATVAAAAAPRSTATQLSSSASLLADYSSSSSSEEEGDT